MDEVTEKIAESIILKEEEDKNLSEGQYRKIFVEYDKTMHALKRILAYGDKLTSSCYNNVAVENGNLDMK